MKRILIWGYWKRNLGDDLFVKTLCQRLPNHNFLFVGSKQYKGFFDEKNLKYINSDNIFFKMITKGVNIYRVISKRIRISNKEKIIRDNFVVDILSNKISDVIYISGSVFMENEKFSYNSIKFQNDVWILKKHPYVVGCNFGPFKTSEFLETYGRLFNNAKWICFRDKYSYNLIKNYCNQVDYSSDLVFAYQMKTQNKIEAKRIGKYWFISVINFKTLSEEAKIYAAIYENNIANVINQLHEEGIATCLCGFYKDAGDYEVINRIENQIKNVKMNCSLVYPDDSMDKILCGIRNCECVIATRHHAMILGFLNKKKVFSIVYDSKMENTLKDMQIESVHYAEVTSLDKINYNYIKRNACEISFDTWKKSVSSSENVFCKLNSYLRANEEEI